MRSENQNSIVLDLGSCHTKVGFGGEKAPRVVYPSVFGTPKKSRVMIGSEYIKVAKGAKLKNKRHILNVHDVYNQKREL